MKHLLPGLLPVFLLGACVRQPSECRTVQTIRTPIYKTRAEVHSSMRPVAARAIHHPGKLYKYGRWIFLSDGETGIHVIDNGNPATPAQRCFLPVPGNIDIAVKDNYLYADCWSELVVFDLNNLADIHPVAFLPNLFPDRGTIGNPATNAPDSTLMIAGFEERDTLVPCQSAWGCPSCGVLASAASVGGGSGGSMARFALSGGYLYTVTGSELRPFSLSNPALPLAEPAQAINAAGETVFPFGSNLFVGTATGMQIFDISNPAQPRYLSRFEHARLCDPVITDGTNAFVTLRSGGFCGGLQNELDVLRVTDLLHPQMLRSYELANPHGLAKDGKLLFVCDGDDGLRVYDASNPADLRLLQRVEIRGTYDVIAENGTLLLVAADGLYQYLYNATGTFRPLQPQSRLLVQP